MRRVFLVLLALAALAACGSSASSAPTSGCSSKDSDQVRGLVAAQQQVWDDANRLASGTSRIAIAPQIAELQRIRRETQAQTYPACGKQVQSSFVALMDATIETYLAFQSQQPDATVSANAQLAAEKRTAFERELLAIGGSAAALVPTATVTPTATATLPPTATATPRPPTPTATATPIAGATVTTAGGACSHTLPYPMERTAENRYATADGQVIVFLFGWPSNTLDSAAEEARRTVVATVTAYKQANSARAPRQYGFDFTGWIGNTNVKGDLYLEAFDGKICGHMLAIAVGSNYNREWALETLGTP